MTFSDKFVVPVWQNGSSNKDVPAIVNAPRTPASVPVRVIPPFVPGGTWRKGKDVIKIGLLRDSIPSSEEKVSAAVAA